MTSVILASLRSYKPRYWRYDPRRCVGYDRQFWWQLKIEISWSNFLITFYHPVLYLLVRHIFVFYFSCSRCHQLKARRSTGSVLWKISRTVSFEKIKIITNDFQCSHGWYIIFFFLEVNLSASKILFHIIKYSKLI